MKAVWALQDAKNRFSALVEHAVQDGPQIVTRHGKETVIVLSVQDFQHLAAAQGSLVMFFRQSPLMGVELDLTREEDYGREIAL